jgi:hypothetical protein
VVAGHPAQFLREECRVRVIPRLPSQIKGTLELMQVSTSLGGTIAGKFKINTTAFEEEKQHESACEE